MYYLAGFVVELNLDGCHPDVLRNRDLNSALCKGKKEMRHRRSGRDQCFLFAKFHSVYFSGALRACFLLYF